MTRLIPLLLAPVCACGAEPAGTLFGVTTKGGTSVAGVHVPMQVLAVLTLLTLLPAILMSVTPFLRITIVLHFLRQALGTQTVPSNQVLIALALFLTIIVIQPVVTEVYNKGWRPYESGASSASNAWAEGSKPMRAFLLRFVREKDAQLLLELSHQPAPARPAELDFTILVPAYVLSELKTGFQIGVALFVPFLVIDLVVASVTLSVGMVQLPPAMLSAPFKIMLFVLVDGWNLVIGSLLKSFY